MELSYARPKTLQCCQNMWSINQPRFFCNKALAKINFFGKNLLCEPSMIEQPETHRKPTATGFWQNGLVKRYFQHSYGQFRTRNPAGNTTYLVFCAQNCMKPAMGSRWFLVGLQMLYHRWITRYLQLTAMLCSTSGVILESTDQIWQTVLASVSLMCTTN